MPHKLAIVTTHPIQYQAPLFRKLAADPRVDLTVFFCHMPNAEQQGEGFGVSFKWDLPLLDGYHYEVLDNVAVNPGVGHFRGCDTPSIERRIAEGKFDAVIVNGWVVKSCLQTRQACRRLGIPCIVRGESNALRPRAWWKTILHRRLLKGYSAFLAIGSSNRQFYLDRGVRPEQIFPAYYCIDNERFAAQAAALAPQRQDLRKRWEITDDRIVYLFCAKFIPKKRPLDVVLAVGRAAAAGHKLHLLMVGDGEERAACEAAARQAESPVTFAGFLNQNELAQAYVAADFLVLPSDHGETWGLVVNEAMACGRPAIVSDQVGCGPDLIQEGDTGASYRCGDISALAELLGYWADRPSEIHAMGAKACRLVGQYSMDAAKEGTIAAVTYVCEGPKSSSVSKEPARL